MNCDSRRRRHCTISTTICINDCSRVQYATTRLVAQRGRPEHNRTSSTENAPAVCLTLHSCTRHCIAAWHRSIREMSAVSWCLTPALQSPITIMRHVCVCFPWTETHAGDRSFTVVGRPVWRMRPASLSLADSYIGFQSVKVPYPSYERG